MFKTHQPIIAAYAEKDADALTDVLVFALATINQKFYNVPNIMQDFFQSGTSKWFTGRTKSYVAEIKSRGHEISTALYSAKTDHERMLVILNLPGFGIPKAGFVCQLVFGTVGCMDTHNLERYGLNAKNFRSDCAPQRLLDRINSYVILCSGIGCAEIWDSWCRYVAALYPDKFDDAHHVSAAHAEALLL